MDLPAKRQSYIFKDYNKTKMKTITINSKRFGIHEIMVDDEDFEKINARPWFLWQCGCGNLYAKTRYLDPGNPRKRFPMHRVIMGVSDPKIMVDHKDRNTLNNQKSNLRIASPRQSALNRRARKNKAGFKGVTLMPSGRYSASIRIDGIKKFSGVFNTAVEAANRYNELAKIHHGEFSIPNPVTAIKYHDGTMYTVEKKTPCSTPIRDKDFIIEQIRTFIPNR